MLKSMLSSLFLFSCLLGLRDCTDLTAKRGADATLKCSGPNDANIIMFKWEKPDLSQGHVIVIKDGIFQKDLQHDSFKGRVDLKDPKWNETGNFSVILKYVTMNDTGRYECHAGYGGQEPELLSNITLEVEKPDQKDITAVSGQNIALPCQNPNNDLIVSTKWKRADLKTEYVVFYRGDEKGQEQHPSFVDRVELQDTQMKDGNVSVILKNVTVNDTGTYECHVIWRGNNQSKTADVDTEPICIINLNVPAGQTEEQNNDGGNKGRGNINGRNEGDKIVGLIVGLIVGALLLVAVVVGFVCWCRKKPKNTRTLQNSPHDASPDPHPGDALLAEKKADEHADMNSDSHRHAPMKEEQSGLKDEYRMSEIHDRTERSAACS